LVSRIASLLIEKDLGLLGTLAGEPDGAGRVKVDLKGGSLGVPLNRWVKKGEIFSLVQPGATGESQAVPWALLRVEEEPGADGSCVCRLFHRYRLSGASGLRCVLLGTVQAPLRLRLMQEESDGKRKPLDATVTLEVRREGFEGEDGGLTLSASGLRDVDTSRRREPVLFDRVAFVTVKREKGVSPHIPVALVDDRLVVVPVPATTEENVLLASRVSGLRRNVLDSCLVQSELFKEINSLTAKAEQRGRAVGRMREALERCRADYSRLSAERDEVAAGIAKLPEKDRPSLSAIDQRLRQIKDGEVDLTTHVENLEKIDREENDPKKKKWREEVVEAQLLEKEFEFDRALVLYDKVLKEGYKNEGLEDHVKKLKKDWEVKDEGQRTARTFIERTWPGLRTLGLKEQMGEAQNALRQIRRVGDRLAAGKFLKATQAHVVRLARELEGLHPDVNSDDARPAQTIKDLLPDLEKLDAELREMLEKR
jgi:hypothetical protein